MQFKLNKPSITLTSTGVIVSTTDLSRPNNNNLSDHSRNTSNNPSLPVISNHTSPKSITCAVVVCGKPPEYNQI